MSTLMAVESFLLHTIGKIMETLRSQGTSLVIGLKKQLQEPLEGIKATVERVEQEKDQNIEVERWLGRVEDVMDDVEDLLDELLTEDLRRRKVALSKVCKFFPSLSSRCYKPDIDAREVKKTLERLLNQVPFCAERSPHLEEGVVGRKTEQERVIQYLTDGGPADDFELLKEAYEKELDYIKEKPGMRVPADDKMIRDIIANGYSVIGIVGMKGIGKTTLAKMVYNDERVKSHFKKRFWVSVSRTAFSYKLKLMEGDSTEPVTEKAASKCVEMTSLLRSKMMKEDEKCLLVVDNTMQEVQDLFSLPLHCKKLMTSRSRHFTNGLLMERFAQLVSLTELSEEDSWSLFIKTASKEQSMPRDNAKFLSAAKEIVKKCQGIPQAIRYTGSLLGSKIPLEGWEKFKKEELPKIISFTSLPSANLEAKFLPFHWNTFRSLPSDRKLCFAYCGLLSADHEYDEQTLITLWMAQGLIKPLDGSQGLEVEEGLSSMFSISHDEWKWNTSRIFSLDTHYHKMAVYAAQGKIILMDPYGYTVHERVRHVTLDFNLDSSWQIPHTLRQAGRLRTILLSPQSQLSHEEKLSTTTCDAIFSNFKRLRALDLHDLGMKIVPDSLGKLKHLRYLDLSKNSFEMLPRCTTNLLNLQTLKLSDCHKLKELPEGIHNLVNLRHLENDGCFSLKHMPPGMGQLASLQTLSTFVVSEDSVSSIGGLKELSQLNNLKGDLEIVHLERVRRDALRTECSILRGKTHLQCLTLMWNRDDWDSDGDHNDDKQVDDLQILKWMNPDDGDNGGDRDDNEEVNGKSSLEYLKRLLIIGFNGKELRSWVSTLSNLVQLSLYNCSRCKLLPLCHQLRRLEILELEKLEDLEFIVDYDKYHSSDTSLKRVTLLDCPSLVSWWKNGNAGHPKLPIEKVEIHYCPRLTTISLRPQELVLVNFSEHQLQKMIKEIEHPSSQLRSLTIGKIEELNALPGEWLRCFTNLECLHVYNCHKLTSLSKGIQHLSSLRELIIEDCSQLHLVHGDDRDKVWEGLKELCSLTIRGIPKLTSLPQGLEKAIYLGWLKLHSCPNLKSLPDWIPRLYSLTIEGCPTLQLRCQEEKGDYWSKIAKIYIRSVK